MKKNNGFTIVELLVVIAIIGVLAAIVMINVLGYINKGKDAAAKGDMATLFTNAITFYNDNGSFDGIEAVADNTKDYRNAKTALAGPKMLYTVTASCDVWGCGQNSTKWCASIQLKSTPTATYYCVDSSGAKKEASNAICSGGVCPD